MKILKALLAMGCLFVCASANADWLYFSAGTKIYRAPPNNPTQLSFIGSINLGPDPSQVGSLAWHPTLGLVGIMAFNTSTTHDMQFVKLDLNTGQGTVIASLGSIVTTPAFYGIDFVSSLSTLLNVRETGVGSNDYRKMQKFSDTGVATDFHIVANSVHFVVHHQGLDRIYMWHEILSSVFEFDPISGSQTFRGNNGEPIHDAAYIPSLNQIVCNNSHNDVLRWNIDGSGNITFTNLGHISITSLLYGIAYVPDPQALVQPASYTVLRGLDFGGNLGSLLNSDDNKVYVLCDEFDANGEIQIISTLPAGTVSQLKFKLEGSASRNDLSQFVRMFNYSTNAYTNVSIQNSTIVDSVVEGTITTGVANYVSGAREVNSRVFWVPQADISNVDGWTQTCDQVLWTMN